MPFFLAPPGEGLVSACRARVGAGVGRVQWRRCKTSKQCAAFGESRGAAYHGVRARARGQKTRSPFFSSLHNVKHARSRRFTALISSCSVELRERQQHSGRRARAVVVGATTWRVARSSLSSPVRSSLAA